MRRLRVCQGVERTVAAQSDHRHGSRNHGTVLVVIRVDVDRRERAGFALWVLADRDASAHAEREPVWQLADYPADEALLLKFYELPHCVGKGVTVVRRLSLDLHGDVMDGIFLQVVCVPEVVATVVQIFAVDGDDLGVIPAHPSSPSADPQLEVVVKVHVGREIFYDGRAVHGHSNDVAEKHPNDDLLARLGRSSSHILDRLCELHHKLAVGRAKARHVAKFLSLRNKVAEVVGEPIVVIKTVVGTCEVGITPFASRRLIDFLYPAMGHVPTLHVVIGMVLP